jgi:hypothetical protein
MTKLASTTRRALLLLTAILPAVAFPAPPPNSPYYTDPQVSYVQDATSQGIQEVNMITCIMSAMNPGSLVNEGPYIALVDQNVCTSQATVASSATGAAAAQAPVYSSTVVNSLRTSNSDPMRVEAWVPGGGAGGTEIINVNLSVTASPTATLPYGSFRLDFCGAAPGSTTCLDQGFLSAGTTGVSFYQTSSRGGTSSTALTLNASGTSAGSGEEALADQNGSEQFVYAYNASLFRRSDGTNDMCFSRDATTPGTLFSVDSYGLYDSSTGERINLNSGFPINFTSGGQTYNLFLSYWGLSVPPSAASLLTSGATVQKIDYSTGTPTTVNYTLVIAPGRLTAYTKQTTTLQALDQIPIDVFINDATNFYPGAPSNTQYELYWDNASGMFHVTGIMNCGSNGCNLQPLPTVQLVDATFWASLGGLNGYSQSFGGQVFVNLAGVTDPVTAAGVPVLYYSQNLVYPNQLPATLYCLNDCPTAAGMASYFAQGSQQSSPFGSSYNNEMDTPLASVVTYTTAQNTAMLLDSTGQPVSFTNASALANQPQYANGISSGRLFTSLAAAQCADNPQLYCDGQTANLDVYYVWQTGSNSWNQFAAVEDVSGTFVQFDAPLLVKYTVPAGAAYGSYAGTTLVLQYGGFGQLWGIPGICVDPVTNATVSCNGQNVQNIAAFEIPDDPATGVVTGTQATYLVKWQQREIRFAQEDLSVCTAAGLSLPVGVSLPDTSNLQSTIDPNSSIYIGTEPTVTASPRVVQGVVEY